METRLFIQCKAALLLLVLMAVMPAKAWTNSDRFDKPKSAFTWNSKGAGCLHFSLLICTPAGDVNDCTLEESTFSLVDENGTKIPILLVAQGTRTDAGYTTCDYANLLFSESEMFLTDDPGLSPRRRITGDRNDWWTEKDAENYYYSEVDWFYPPRFAGKKFKLRVDGQLWHNDDTYTDYNVEIGTIEFDDMNFQCYDMIPGSDSSENGFVKIPFSCDRPIYWIEASYTDENGNFKQLPRSELAKNTYAGFLMLPATETHQNLTITANVQSASWSDNPPGLDYPTEVRGSITLNYDPNSDAVMHNPRQLKAELLRYSANSLTDAGSVQLRWETKNPAYNDVMDGDQFVVMRSLTGKLEDLENIGSVTIDEKDSVYTFKDSTLISALTVPASENICILSQVLYTVIRGSAQQLWGVDDNPASASVTVGPELLHLLRIKDYSAKWEDETEHTVKVNWNYADEHGAVWDDRAQMKLVFSTTNREGAPVDTTTYVLTADEIKTRSKVVALNRSCVDYKTDLFVEQGTSPVPLNADYLIINSADDWHLFAKKVLEAHGKKNVNAMLNADITINEKVGYISYPFTGIFEGNGHTLKYNVTDGTATMIAPFSFVKDATIRNLHTEGSITSSNKFVGGIVGEVLDGTCTLLEGCSSSMVIGCTIDGDASSGGLVGYNANSPLILRNCKFDGSFAGDNCSHNGGLVGWTYGKVTIENCLFMPSSITTKYNDCSTWARTNNADNLNVINSYFTQAYDEKCQDIFLIGSTEDWNAFRQAVQDAAGTKDVNAILTADISVDASVGGNTFPYWGTFEGNGHSLNLKISSAEMFEAPFKYVGSANIKNLHLTGTLDGGNFASGLIGTCTGDTTININNCRVSVAVSSNGQQLGGFVGSANKSKVIFQNCLFDGKLVCSNGAKGGAFIGWEPNDGTPENATYNGLKNCLENGSYEGIVHAGCNFNPNGVWGAGYGHNLWSYHWWTEAQRVGAVSEAELVTKLGTAYWKLENGSVVPVMESNRTIVGYSSNNSADHFLDLLGTNGWHKDKDGYIQPLTKDKTQATIGENAELPTFYYENMGKVDSTSLVTETQQCSVILTWENETDDPVDYYEVWRSDVKQPDSIQCIATQLTEKRYEDKQTSPVHQYLYFVRGVNDCEGKTFTDTKTVSGQCVQTGTIEGYLRFADETGIPNVDINFTLDGDTTSVTVRTDESGFFRVTGLPYVDGTETTYSVMPGVNGYTGGLRPVSLGTKPGDNLVKNVVFEIAQSVKFSGYVQYDGTSIPVQGVSFKVDGYEVHNASGLVTTDHEGKYAFRMLEGDHVIQAFKDGHGFYQDGYFYADDNDTVKTHNFTIDKAGIIFYDTTRVKLIGRVCGGKEQGAIPLGNSLSRNNLGDELQMVLTLEGDNSSRLVWDIEDRNKKERDEVFTHKAHDKKYDYQTKVHTTLNRMIVSPDVHTGEYEVWLPPVKWKIQQITAKGYATLFQNGQVGDVIDLSDSLTLHSDTIAGEWMNANGVKVNTAVVDYHAKYNRIYHSPVHIDYKQQSYDPFSYFGDRYYNFKNLAGDKQKLSLAYGVRKPDWPVGKKDSLETVYTFGYPVFSLDRKYPVTISATEKYFYNNNTKNDTVDVIRLSGGEVVIHNGMVSSTHKDVVELDSLGEATYVIEAMQTPYLLTGEDALRTVSMTLEMDGTHYEATPLRAYVLNIQYKEGAKDILSYSTPQLIDILRDPPGGTSKATISKGSTLKYTYQMDMSWEAGTAINLGVGWGLNTFTGFVAAPFGAGGVAGFNNGGSNYIGTTIDLIWSGSGNRAFSYTMNVNEDISTSADKKMVGADADLYIGIDQSIVLKPATAIRAIPDSVFRQLDGLLKSGRMVEIASGIDDDGKTLHLVRDEVVTYGPKLNSTFIHSQSYIVKQLIPSLAEQCLSLIFTGTEAEAQQRADATGEPVYLSLVDKDDQDFGVNYKMVIPTGTKDIPTDEVKHFHDIMERWIAMIAQNEKEKMDASDLVKNFDVDGASSLSYGESFTSDYSCMKSTVNPFEGITTEYFDSGSTNAAMGALEILGPIASKLLGGVLKHSFGKTTGSKNKTGLTKVEVNAVGLTFKFSLDPALGFDVTPKNTESKSYNRKESFTIGMDKKSHLDFDVYRVSTKTDSLSTSNVLDVFYNENFKDQVDFNEKYLKRDMKLEDIVYSKSFVYRTRGGATLRPWEGERKTLFYNPGTVMDERTKKIENPIIKMDKQSVSGVPFGEPARFKLYLTNESEHPEAVYNYFDIYQVEKYNPNGAKLMIDGMPLTGNMRTIEVRPGQVTEKTLEVYASEKFDYEGLKIGMISQGDLDVFQEVAFDVHYLQTAGPVTISTPGDKWIMNCDAPQEGDKGWYLPVVISGFDKNQHNFDHIEFQYKESTRGDDYWTNLCGYYADSALYAAASGTKAMIPENGNITTRFFGEGVVMEKAYDMRAVLFCRNGNSFLTYESKVLSGVKDTRRPQLFGSAEPKDGMLGAGENIIFNFSEDIEYDYLQATTNFEVKGETNESGIQTAPALQFGGSGYAQSEARRNFSDKSVTVEVMIKPDDTDYDMPIFSHGRDGKQLQLWLTKDKHLKAVVDDKVLVSDSVFKSTGFQRVAMVLDNEHKRLTLFGESKEASLDGVTYSGYGPITFGAATQSGGQQAHYQGCMLQARVWDRVMDINLLNNYGNRMLTGYEMGLTDYYPMNEGKGDYATDLAQGAHLMLNGASWAQPNGMSLKFEKKDDDSQNGLELDSKIFARDKENDYSLLFWFKTKDESAALYCNGSGQNTDVKAKEKFFIGFENNTLKYRTNGHEYALGDQLNDDEWHHYAMTVNRVRQVASIYIDNELKAQFSTDSLGGMTGGQFFLGNMVWQTEGVDNATVHYQNGLTGHIDGFAMFEQALPVSLIKRYSTKSPGGSERGLIAYVDFDRQERQKNGDLVLEPYVLSKKVKYDNDGNPTDKRDTLFVASFDSIMNRVDRNIGAPVQAYEELRNLNFSFVGRNNQLLVNIDELDTRINKRSIYVTVEDIPDKNGNFMASPQTECFYVNRNPLTWDCKRYVETLKAGEEHTIRLNIINNGGAAHTYTIENLPRWMSVNKTSDVIDPLASDELTLTVSKDVNVGTFDYIIYLIDENGLSEPLPMVLTIEGEEPNWEVNPDLKRYSMNVVGQVRVGGTLVTDSHDKVAVFDANGRCMGCDNVKYDAATGRSMVYLTVYDSTTVATELFFRLWHYTTGKTMQLTTSQEIHFGDQTIIGTVSNPIQMSADDLYLQEINLEEGWNWISFNVYNKVLENLSQVMNIFQWQEGDILTEDSEDLTLAYKNGKWMSNTKPDISKVSLSQEYCYRIKVKKGQHIELWGTSLKDPDQRTIPVYKGWNSIGYTPMVNLPVTTALTEYFDEATDGDVIKNQRGFAMFASDGAGGGEWLGTLEYMKPGEGYMLYHQKEDSCSFRYPYYEPGTTFIDMSVSWVEQPNASRFATTMNMIAEAKGVEVEDGDLMVAYANGETVGKAYSGAIEKNVFFLNIVGDVETPLAFTIERDGAIIASTGEVMTYEVNGISGTPAQPTKINFAKTDVPQHGWYNVQGMKLDKRPKRSGVYIYNGKKQVIK